MTGCELGTKSGISESAVEEGWEEDREALEGVNSCPAGPCWEPGTRPGQGRGLPCLPSPCSSPFSLPLDRVEQATACSHREIC